MAHLIVIADDLTGALDTGVQFANSNVLIRVAAAAKVEDIPADIFDCDIAVLDAELRHRTAQEAYRHCAAVVQAAVQRGAQTIYLKTDSGLRGNIGAMFQAALDSTGATFAAFAPALPRMGRVTCGGIAYIDGLPIDKSVFGQDPFEPVRSPYVKDLFTGCQAVVKNYPVGGGWDTQNLTKPTIGIFDAACAEDFTAIANHLKQTGQLQILGGCAGFAASLPPIFGLEGPPVRLPCVDAPLLVLCGSLNPITKCQLEYGAKHGGIRISLQEEQLQPGYFDTPNGQAFLQKLTICMVSGRDILMDTGGTEKAESAGQADALRQVIAGQLGDLMCRLLAQAGSGSYLPMIIGGDTLMGFMQHLPQAEISPLGEAAPGAVLFSAVLPQNTRLIISKSGGFGSEDLLANIHSNLQKGINNEAISACHAASGIQR